MFGRHAHLSVDLHQHKGGSAELLYYNILEEQYRKQDVNQELIPNEVKANIVAAQAKQKAQ